VVQSRHVLMAVMALFVVTIPMSCSEDIIVVTVPSFLQPAVPSRLGFELSAM